MRHAVQPLRRWLPPLALAAMLLPLQAMAGPALDATADARAWLARIQAAAHSNYQGTLVFMVGGSMSSTRVGHYAVGGQTFEVLESLDGRQQRVLRHNEAVHTLWPQTRLVVVERRTPLMPGASTPQAVEPQALERYVFRPEGPGRVAGRDALAFVLEPRDTLRYAQRLWADQASGLMLRADVIELTRGGEPVRVLESTRFSDVAVGVAPQGEAVLAAIRGLGKLDGWRVVRPRTQATTLDGEGFHLARPVPGFALAGCVRRSMDTAGDEQSVLQAVFTDGLTLVSLFIEPFNPQHHRAEMLAQQGATATLLTRRGEHWITAVGDVPAGTLKLFADAIDRRRP